MMENLNQSRLFELYPKEQNMKVLVACEESQRVCIEFRNRGHEAYSCDLQECSGGHHEWHIQGDVLSLLNGNCEFTTCDGSRHTIDGRWSLIIAHPPCTDLASSGSASFAEKREDGRQRDAIEFFCNFLDIDCDRVCIENPIGIICGVYIKEHFPDLCEKYGLPIPYTQIIQPFHFGHPTRKSTCLWLKGLPKLCPTNVVEPDLYVAKNGVSTYAYWHIETLRLPPEERRRERSKTYIGIAKAMAEQWG